MVEKNMKKCMKMSGHLAKMKLYRRRYDQNKIKVCAKKVRDSTHEVSDRSHDINDRAYEVNDHRHDVSNRTLFLHKR